MLQSDISDILYDDDNECIQCNDNNMQSNIYQYDYDYADDIQITESFKDNYYNCLIPSIYSTIEYLLPLFIVNITFKIIATQTVKVPSHVFLNILSTIFGIFVIYYYAPGCFYLLLCYTIVSYAWLCIPIRQYPNQRIEAFIISLGIILYCEYTMDPAEWHKVRSVVMIAAMKAVSVFVDNTNKPFEPSFLAIFRIVQYTGYIFNPSTLLFGPWISYQDYIVRVTHVEEHNNSTIKLLLNLLQALKNFFLSLTFLVVSNCWAQWFISDDNAQLTGGKWLLAYKDALSFRTSHYFISYLSGTFLIIGSSASSILSPLTAITRPIDIEMPRSLVQVVISWNIPMHTWLKLYIFRPAVKSIGKFNAVTLTYLISSLLHGLNFQLAAVLLSLGLYTYIEFQLRNILANTFDACITAKECVATSNKVCRYTRHWYNNSWVFITNLGFSTLAVFHLAYLGLMFDTSALQETGYNYLHTIEKWSKLNFASHWVAATMYLIYFFIK